MFLRNIKIEIAPFEFHHHESDYNLLNLIYLKIIGNANDVKFDKLKASSTQDKKLKVVNGLPAKPGQFPFIVSLNILNSTGSYTRCGGSLYGSNLIVSAGK
jgi:hypothetical protein